MEQHFQRTMQTLEEVFAFVDRFAADSALDEETSFCIHVAVEELFTNMVKYNAGSPCDISIRLARDDAQVTVTLVDPDADRFDVTAYRGADVHGCLRSRRKGGLGLHLVRKLMDGMDYAYLDRCSTVVLTKKLTA